MDLNREHEWDVTPQEAIALQTRLQREIILEDRFPDVQYVGGVDVGIARSRSIARAAAVVLRLDSLEVIDSAWVEEKVAFPYVPGLLSFREVPPLLSALQKLSVTPQLLLCDGQGIAHPRRLGVACHLGLLTGIPCIGVAKSRLIGSHAEVPSEKGSWVELHHDGEVIGAVLRSREKVKPLYVSPGHLVSLCTALHYTLLCISRYRLPETTRAAHKLSTLNDR